MKTFIDLKDFFQNEKLRMIIAADAETQILTKKKDDILVKVPAGGVAVALEPIAKASNAIYIARGKTKEEEEILKGKNKTEIEDPDGKYTLKRLFFNDEDFNSYYNGFANQTLWPLCHVSFERPEFNSEWFAGYKRVNEKFAKAIKEEIEGKNTFVWVHDYQLALVPKLINRSKDIILAMFWHIPWPTWEVFRILPQKKEILESLLTCDFLAFHRGYHVRNFLETVQRELEARIDDETNKIYYNGHITTVKNLPLGIDTDVLKSFLTVGKKESFIGKIVKGVLGKSNEAKKSDFSDIFEKNMVILGVDRLDYTKGLRLRLMAIDAFFSQNPKYIGNTVYLGIIAPSRGGVPAYQALEKQVRELAGEINNKHKTKDWQPIHLVNKVFTREEIINLYKKASACLVTPLDDGMNLVSKEFVIASYTSQNPGMLVLSQFAGSAIDLTRAIIINPYDTEELASAIKTALEMGKDEKKKRIKEMTETLEEKNVYAWAEDFVRNALE